jgi:hypothetical protein
MRVTFETHGGHLPFAKKQSRTLDVNPSDVAEFQRLLAAAQTPPGAAGDVPDSMSYVITAQVAAGRPVVLRQGDGNMTPAFSQLVDWLDRH